MNSTILGCSTSPTKAKTAIQQVQRIVFMQRIRIKDFFMDSDKLRKGLVTKAQFLQALNTAALHKWIQPSVLEEVADMYLTVTGNPPVDMVNYREFCEVVNEVFTTARLEKTPQLEVPPEPTHLLDRTRYEVCSKVLEPEKEDRILQIIEDLQYQARTQRILIKPFFDDACKDKNSPCLVGHVTWQQFKQVLQTKLGFKLHETDTELLVEKYVDDFYGDMVNYIAFAREVDPAEDAMNMFEVPAGVHA